MGEFWFSKNYFFSSLMMSSPGGPRWHGEMGKYHPKRHCSMAIAALSIFGAKLKIALKLMS